MINLQQTSLQEQILVYVITIVVCLCPRFAYVLYIVFLSLLFFQTRYKSDFIVIINCTYFIHYARPTQLTNSNRSFAHSRFDSKIMSFLYELFPLQQWNSIRSSLRNDKDNKFEDNLQIFEHLNTNLSSNRKFTHYYNIEDIEQIMGENICYFH